MKFYVASRFRRYQRARAVIEILEQRGHTITFDWTRSADEFDQTTGEPLVPVGGATIDTATIEEQGIWADNDQQGVEDSDGVIVIADSDLYGALIETGIAFGRRVPVAVIAPERWSIFWAPSEMRRVKVFRSPIHGIRWLESLGARRLHGADAHINI